MNNKLKNTIIVTASIVTVLCVVFGSIYHLGNAFTNVFTIGNVTFHGIFSDWNEEGRKVSTAADLGEVKDIELAINVADLVIERGDKNTIEIDCNNEEYAPKYSYEGGTLKIYQNAEEVKGANNVKGIDVKVTLKDDLDNLTGEINVGDVDFNDLVVNNMDIQLDLGDFDMEGGRVGDFRLTGNLGDLDVRRVDFDSAVIKCDMGDVDIELKDAFDSYSIKADVSLGELEVNGKNPGKTYNSTGGTKTLTATTSLGDLDIN